jgi:hypothetical protein
MDLWFEFIDIHMTEKIKCDMVAMLLNGKTQIFLQL